MKHVVVTFCVALLLFSCQRDMNKPNPFIEQSKMEDILYDMALLYGMQTTNSFATDTVKAIEVKDVFEKYQIDSLTFTTNNRYYVMLKKGVYLDMQMRVMERLKKEKERIDSLAPKTPDLTPIKEVKMNAVKQDTVSQLKEEVLVSTTDTNKKITSSKKEQNKVQIKKMTPEQKKRLQKAIKAIEE